MKFSPHALHQLAIFGVSCICFSSASPEDFVPNANTAFDNDQGKSPAAGSHLRRRELTPHCETNYTWEPGMTLDVSSCSNDEVVLARPTDYKDHVVRQVCINEICNSNFFLAGGNNTRGDCLTIPEGPGNYRGIKLSSNEDVKARVFASGEVECIGDGEFTNCRTDYGWLPGMTLKVFDEIGDCQSTAGCWIERASSSNSTCPVTSNSSGTFEIARPDGASNGTVVQVYSSVWDEALGHFHSASGGEANKEDCLIRPTGSPGEYGGIKLSSNPETRVQAVISDDGSVYCRSLRLGDTCASNEQCLTGVCNQFASPHAKCDVFNEGEVGAMCSKDGDCITGECAGDVCALLEHGR